MKTLSSLQLVFTQYCFLHSGFYLYSIVFITTASVHKMFFSLLQVLFLQYYFHHFSLYLYIIIIIPPAPFNKNDSFITPSSSSSSSLFSATILKSYFKETYKKQIAWNGKSGRTKSG